MEFNLKPEKLLTYKINAKFDISGKIKFEYTYV